MKINDRFTSKEVEYFKNNKFIFTFFSMYGLEGLKEGGGGGGGG
jgi:hypothetical protein